MKPRKTLAALTLWFAATATLPILAAETASPASGEAIKADTVLRQMSEKLSAATQFSFKARREIDAGLAGGDGLHGGTKIAVEVQRPDKVVARGTIPGDERRFYFDGKQLTLVDVKKKTYSTVPLVSSLDKLSSDLATTYGFTFPVGEFVIRDLYADLAWRAQSFEYRGTDTLKSGFLGLKRVRCHRVGLTGKHADSEIWIGMNDFLPRRWISTVKGPDEHLQIRLELSDWNLRAATRDEDFVFSPGKDALPIPMMTEADMAAAHKTGK